MRNSRVSKTQKSCKRKQVNWKAFVGRTPHFESIPLSKLEEKQTLAKIKGEYFEKEIDGETKLFRKRFVPMSEVEQLNLDSDLIFESMRLAKVSSIPSAHTNQSRKATFLQI